MTESEKTQNRFVYAMYFVYLTTYMAKLNYGAMMVELIDALGSTKAAAGLVTSVFFFAYGAGQFVNGMFTKYYNHQIIGTAALVMSGTCNLMMALCSSVGLMKYIWLVNALSLSVLWSGIVCLLGRYLNEKYIKKSLALFGTVSAVGTSLNYLSCSVVIAFLPWQTSFYIGAAVMFISAYVWYKTVGAVKQNCELLVEVPSFKKDKRESLGKKKRKPMGKLFIMGLAVFFLCAFFAEASVDGITTWMPNMLYEVFCMPKSFSVVLTVALPLSAVLMNFLLIAIEKKTKSFHVICMASLGSGAVIIVITVLLFYRLHWAMLFPIMCLVRCCCTMITSITTGHMPVYYRDKADSGTVSGIAEGFCYVGSAFSTYFFGVVADKSGWTAVLSVVGILLVSGAVCCLAYVVISAVVRKKKRITAG